MDFELDYNKETNTIQITNNEYTNNEEEKTILLGSDNTLVELTENGELVSVTIEDIQW